MGISNYTSCSSSTIFEDLKQVEVWGPENNEDKVLIDVFSKDISMAILWLSLLAVLILLLLLLEKLIEADKIYKDRFASLFVLYHSNLTSTNGRIEREASSLSQSI